MCQNLKFWNIDFSEHRRFKLEGATALAAMVQPNGWEGKTHLQPEALADLQLLLVGEIRSLVQVFPDLVYNADGAMVRTNRSP
jgi:hypothetical protein